jgi:phosphofructokinase-like protein
MKRKVGILTGGGDAPGLNAVIRGFARTAIVEHGIEVVGVVDCFNGLFETPRRLRNMDLAAVRGLLHRGGTVLGTTNRGDPFSIMTPNGRVNTAPLIAQACEEEGIEGLVVLGGDGTQRIALRLMEEAGIRVIGVPKTIDNDLSATDLTFGFQSAVSVATDALDRLHTTAEAHQRVMLLEVMGRDVGHIALHAGIAGGADVVLIPEIPYDPDRVAAKIARRYQNGATFSIVVVAEGALPVDNHLTSEQDKKTRLKRGGGAASIAMQQLDGRVEAEMRVTVLGHVQRGGAPVAFDRVLATQYGVAAAHLAAEGGWGRMVALRDGRVDSVPLAEAAVTRPVDVHGPIMKVARSIGIEFGG